MKTSLKFLALTAAVAFLAGCQVTMPLGESGRYGEVFAGYRPPAQLSVYGVNVTNPPRLRDK
jgi:hypothetical protein